MISNFKLEIITPEKTIFTSEVDQVTIPSYEGEMTILKDHIALVTFLRPGILKIGEKDLESFYLDDGIVEFSNNILLILTASARNLKELKENEIESLLKEVSIGLDKSNLSDKEKYVLSHKADILETIRK
tara:strand:- start:878 stop:1267 length:390 start_codon:yes stop_codon:yes gene_type:complete